MKFLWQQTALARVAILERTEMTGCCVRARALETTARQKRPGLATVALDNTAHETGNLWRSGMFAFARFLKEVCSPIARFVGLGQSPGSLTASAQEESSSLPHERASELMEDRVEETGVAERSESRGVSRAVIAMATLPLGLACVGMGSVSARSGENSAAFKSSKVWEDDMNEYFRARFLLRAGLKPKKKDDTILIFKVMSFEEPGKKAWRQTDVGETYDTVLIPEVESVEDAVEIAGDQADVAQADDSSMVPETRGEAGRRKTRKNARKGASRDASVAEAYDTDLIPVD